MISLLEASGLSFYSLAPKQNNKFREFIVMFIFYRTFLYFISIIGDKMKE